MNKYLASKLDMYRAVTEVRLNPLYRPAIDAIPGIGGGFSTLEDHIAQGNR